MGPDASLPWEVMWELCDGQEDVVELAVQAGWDLDNLDDEGNTPLIRAVANGTEEWGGKRGGDGRVGRRDGGGAVGDGVASSYPWMNTPRG